MVAEVSRPTYRVNAEKHEGWWLLTSPQVPGAVSRVRRLTAADEHAREAIAFVLDARPDSFDLDVIPSLGGTLDRKVAAAREAVRAAADAQREAANQSRKVVAELVKKGLTGAEVAAVLRLSPQRVSQLLAGDKPRTPSRRAARFNTTVKSARSVAAQSAKAPAGKTVKATGASRGLAASPRG